jgi:hypothetical protein
MTTQPGNPPENLDALLDRVLASYTPAAPRPGFEQRLQTRLAAETGPRRRPFFLLPWAWATSAILAAGLALAAIHHFRQVPDRAKRQPIHANSPLLANARDRRQDVSPLPRSPSAHLRARGPARGNQTVSAIERTSLREMRAPSHPAPEEPLTEEEKLLLQVVHKGDAQEMAMLNPAVREKQEAEEEAEFHKFVEQSIKGESE